VSILLTSVDVGQAAIDACTLNNVLNIAQLIGLAAVIRLLRRET
jgi:hypothetical protein